MLSLSRCHSSIRLLWPSRIACRWGSGGRNNNNDISTSTTTTATAATTATAKSPSSSASLAPIRPKNHDAVATDAAVDGNELHRQGMEQLQKTNPWLYRMAPPRGGTTMPDAKFMAVFAVVSAVGFYAWFVDPPSAATADEKDAITKTAE